MVPVELFASRNVTSSSAVAKRPRDASYLSAVSIRHGRGLDPSMGWIGLGWVGLGWVENFPVLVGWVGLG